MAHAPAVIPIPEGGFRAIAVLRLSSLGDIVLTLPVVHALARAFPAARLSYWVKEEFRDVVRFDPAISHVRSLEADGRQVEDLVSMSAELEDCDLIVDLQRNSRTRLLTFRQRAPVLRAPSYRWARSRWVHARWSRPRPLPSALERYARALEPIGVAAGDVPHVASGVEVDRWAGDWMSAWAPARAPVVLCPGARHVTKRWPEAHWLTLDAMLAAAGRPRLVLSTSAERRALPDLAARIDAAHDARWCTEPIARMTALLSHATAAVSNDSGLMHLAAARGVRVVAMFGSTSPVLGFAPAGPGHVVLCRDEPCQPCTLHGRASCPRGHFNCMRKLLPATVEDALATVLASAR